MIDIIGYIGMVLILSALYLTREHYKSSQIVNFFGGIVMAIYSYFLIATPTVLLNIIFCIICIYNLIKLRGKKQ
jgi:hypothetical protein